METLKKKIDWFKLTKPYQAPENLKSWWQIASSFIGFVGIWIVAFFALKIHFILMLPIAFLAALFAVKIFIIQHDCGHGSFFKNKVLRDHVGSLCSIVTMVPYEEWQYKHAQHHTHLGKEENLWKDIGDIDVLTSKEYLRRSKWQRAYYLFYRNPIILFLLGPAYVFFIEYRLPHPALRKKENLRWSVWNTNIGLLALFFWGSSFTGVYAFLLIHLITLYFATIIAAWLFYIQHQFEDRYVEEAENWDYAEAAIYGSSYFKLPKLLQWFTGNIGFHHIHHLSPTVPNYKLEKCHKDNPVFEREVYTLTLLNCWETMRLKFWDKDLKRMITYKELCEFYGHKDRILSRILSLRLRRV